MKIKKSNVKTGRAAVQPNHENHHRPENDYVGDEGLNPPVSWSMAWSMINANLGLTLPFIVVEHLFETDNELGWRESTGKPGVTKQDSLESAVRRTGLGYLRLRDRVRARALLELPLADSKLVCTLGMAGFMVDEAFLEAIRETEHALYRRPIWLDYFADCIYPVVKQKLQAKLGLAVEPATVLQTWLLDIEG